MVRNLIVLKMAAFALFAAIAGLSIGCAGNSAARVEYMPDQQKQHEVVILYHSTDYKSELVTGLAKALKGRQVHVITDDIANANAYTPESVDVVVVIGTVYVGKTNSEAADYLKAHIGAGNLIYATTSGSGHTKGIRGIPELTGVDVITCASDIDQMGSVNEKILQRVMLHLNSDQAAVPQN